MWVEETSAGNYKFCERYVEPLTGKKRRISVTLDKNTAASRKLASELLHEKITVATSQQASYNKSDNMTFAELVTLYLAYQEKSVAPSTYRRNHAFCNTIMRLLDKDVLVNKLTVAYIKDHLMEKDVEAGTLNDRYKRLKSILRWGYENEYINDIRYLDKIKPLEDKKKKEKLEEKFLEKSDIPILLSGFQNKQWKLLTELLLLSGARCGEALALDIYNRTIY